MEKRRRGRKETWKDAVPPLSQSAVICRGIVHLKNHRKFIARAELTRRFYHWKGQAAALNRCQSRGQESNSSQEDEEVSKARANILELFENTEHLYTELAQVNSELDAMDRALRQNGSRVVLRQFIKQRLYARIQRAFTMWAISAKAGSHSPAQFVDVKRGIKSMKAEEDKAEACQKQNTRLRFAMLVNIFLLKWKSYASIAALQAERERDEFNQRVLWNEVCALRLGLQKADEYESAVLCTAQLRGGATFDALEKMRNDLKSLPKSFAQHRSHHHHHHHHQQSPHHHHRHHHRTHNRIRGAQSRSPSPEKSRNPLASAIQVSVTPRTSDERRGSVVAAKRTSVVPSPVEGGTRISVSLQAVPRKRGSVE